MNNDSFIQIAQNSKSDIIINHCKNKQLPYIDISLKRSRGKNKKSEYIGYPTKR